MSYHPRRDAWASWNKDALVTGGSSGIGLASAKRFVDEGPDGHAAKFGYRRGGRAASFAWEVSPINERRRRFFGRATAPAGSRWLAAAAAPGQAAPHGLRVAPAYRLTAMCPSLPPTDRRRQIWGYAGWRRRARALVTVPTTMSERDWRKL